MKYYFILISLLFSFCCSAQLEQMVFLEDSIAECLKGISSSSSDEHKLNYSQTLEELLSSSLANPEVFNYDFKKIQKMAILKPEDQAFMLFNWNIPLNNGVNKFKAFLIIPTDNDNTVSELSIPTRTPKKMESRYLDLDQWYGCLYYEIIPIKKGKQKVYTLLGYSPEKKALTKKYIDVLTIKNGQARLGEAVFEGEKGIKKRVIFEFSAEVSMMVRYQEKLKRIIVDHLTPRSPEMEGNFQFYGPDGTFDAYLLEKNIWKLTTGVDFQATEKSNKVYKDPRFFRKRKR